MRVFGNFFLKVLAFLTAITVFITILTFLFSLMEGQEHSINYIYKEGKKDSENKIIILRLRGPIINEPSDRFQFEFLNSSQIIYVNKVKKLFKTLEKENLKGIIISIDSPGGSVSATYNLYETINNFKIKNQIKIYLHTNELLASGAYWISLAGDKIYANYGSIIGSIGVKGPDWIYFNKVKSIGTGLFGQTIETEDGIKKFTPIAGDSKDIFDSFRSPSNKEVEALNKIVKNIYSDFVNVVSKNRKIERKYIVNELGALVFDSKTAKDNYLIDDVLNFEATLEQLIKDLSIEDYVILEIADIKKSFFDELTQNLFFKTNNYNQITKQIKCDIISKNISVIFAESNGNNNC